ncbi:IS66-like element accessory protein TnpA [Fodinicurvata sediminis]|uniref:IS66-like element accessory protein TnpA n=4 Tax=Fodinicurvata sediminis TaxID=1121832 RepID=UPI0009DBBFF6|nr:transposase [Fodinicurvata sediminis]
MDQHLLVEEFDHSVERLDVLEGPTGRRRWTEEAKARIVAESFEPDARVAEVARRHGLRPQHLSSWRRQARAGQLPGLEPNLPEFARVEVERSEPQAAAIEIVLDGLSVRVPAETAPERLAHIVSALRAAS